MLSKTYKARYYDGKSSAAYTVDLSLLENELQIHFVDLNGNPVQVIWQKDLIRETDYSSAIIVLRYNETFPYQQLEITDREFIQMYKEHFKVSKMKQLVHRRGRTWFLGILSAFVALLLLCYFFVLPLMADLVAQSFPKDYEIEMGKGIYTSVLQGEDIDTLRTGAINEFFKQLKVEGDYPVEITVVKKDVTNAFALPGGGIVVYSKILDSMKSSDQLAALLAHEYSHVQLKHATRGIFRNLAGYLFVSLIFSDVNGMANVVVQNANNLRNLSYSRTLESEADQNGLEILVRNRVNPRGMKQLFEQLKKEDHLIELNEMLSTHPDLDERIKSVNQYVRTHKVNFPYNDSLEKYFLELKTLPANKSSKEDWNK